MIQKTVNWIVTNDCHFGELMQCDQHCMSVL